MDSIRVVVFCRGSPRGYPTCSPASNLRASISRLSNHNHSDRIHIFSSFH